jgi:hypothetical protein
MKKGESAKWFIKCSSVDEEIPEKKLRACFSRPSLDDVLA